jgi:hypothetical protein
VHVGAKDAGLDAGVPGQELLEVRRFASLLVRDRALAQSLADGFEALWQKALKSLGEVRFLPRPRS